ncbi:hypothetical protein I4U23_029486 [Adineta vaga]|nr:hypothetical protein I4U23_029486 [Adineta vaga]
MTKLVSIQKRNIDDIRRKNLEDNQLFLKQLLMNDIRDEFINSARSILRKKDSTEKMPIQYEKVEYPTRYSLKVKSGAILPYTEQRQLDKERKLMEKEQRKRAKEMRQQRRRHPSRWSLFDKNNPEPYRRIFKPRHTKIDERIEQEITECCIEEH